MSRNELSDSDATQHAEYDFYRDPRGEHFEHDAAGRSVVVLDADVAKAFKDAEGVNRALRMLIELARNQVPPERAG